MVVRQQVHVRRLAFCWVMLQVPQCRAGDPTRHDRRSVLHGPDVRRGLALTSLVARLWSSGNSRLTGKPNARSGPVLTKMVRSVEIHGIRRSGLRVPMDRFATMTTAAASRTVHNGPQKTMLL